MTLTWRYATEADVNLLAEWNYQLIKDEAHRNSMNVAQLQDRMRGWLTGEYQAVIFSESVPVAHALFKREDTLIHLRQFFVRRDKRRNGIGRAAFIILKDEIWPSSVRWTVEVLCANHPAIGFWNSVGYREYSLVLEIMPK
jgi:GNAT superfamily N-acetyltransferase